MSIKMNLDWSQFTRRVFIEAQPKEVFQQWSSTVALETWFLEEVEFQRNGEILNKQEIIREGDNYRWKWHGWEGEQKGKILEVLGNKSITFSFGQAGEVNIEFISDPIGCQLVLKQYNIPTDEQSIRNYYYGCTNGWSFWMLNCKLFIEKGFTINQKTNPLPDEIKCELINA